MKGDLVDGGKGLGRWIQKIGVKAVDVELQRGSGNDFCNDVGQRGPRLRSK
jgi:hypothetical protein